MDNAPQVELSSDNDSGNDSDNERQFKRKLISAIEGSNFQALQRLFQNTQHPIQSFVNTRDGTDKNNTLLHIAVRARKGKRQNENTQIIQLLVQEGADKHAENDNGETPCDLLKKRAETGPRKVDWKSVKHILCSNATAKRSPDDSQLDPVGQTSKKRRIESNEDVIMENEDISYKGNETYRASGLKRNLHGAIYQLQILLIFLHRATKFHEFIYLASEMDEAEKFDDVFLRYQKTKGWNCRFVQVKHLLDCEKHRITKTQLLSKAKKAKFGLYKYFESYCKIVEKPPKPCKGDFLEEFSICTNTYFASDAANYFVEDDQFKNDVIMYFDNHQAMGKYKLRPDFNEFQPSKLKNKHLKQFIEKFRFIVNYPNRNQMNVLIDQEIGEDFCLLNSDLACNTLKNDVLNWFLSYKDKRSEFLHIKDSKRFLKSIKSRIRLLMMTGVCLAYPEELVSYSVQFANVPNQFLQFNKFQMFFLKSKYPLLTSIKMNQYLRQMNMYQFKDDIIFVQLKTLCYQTTANLVHSSFSSRTTFHLLIIDCGLSSELMLKRHELNDICGKLLKILCEEPTKKLVLIGDCSHPLMEKFMDANSGLSYEAVDDPNISYGDLTDFAQATLLDTPIYLQGRKLPLKHIINEHSASLLIDNLMLVELLKGREMHIDALTSRHDLFVDNYVSRTLSHQIISSKALRDQDFLRDNILMVSQANRQAMLELNADAEYINEWTGDDEAQVQNGITLISDGMVVKDIQASQNTNVYYLEYLKGRLVWTQFVGDAQPLRRYIDEQSSPGVIEETQLSEMKSKLNILAADPGFGKSFLMSNLCKELRATQPRVWTKRINLNEHTIKSGSNKVLGDIDFPETDTVAAIRFLTSILFQEGGHQFQKNLFELSLQGAPIRDYHHKYPEIILLFDGFDEISPKYKEQTLVLLKALRNSHAKCIWVTTRPHERPSLEDALKVAALGLNPFSPEQKIRYLEDYRRLHPSKDLYDNICSCLNDININISDEPHQSPEAEFTDVPLHLRMLAEVGFKIRSVNLSNLYKEFISIKFNIYYDEKSSTSSARQADDDIRQRDLQNLSDVHASLAFELLFPDLADETLTLNKQELALIGFIVVNEGGVQFTHRSFAEYFVTFYIAKHIKSQKIQTLFWDSVLTLSEYKLLRSFVNECEPILSNLLTMSACKEKILEVCAGYYFDIPFEERLNNIAKVYLELLKQNGDSVLIDIREQISANYNRFDKREENDRKLSIFLKLLLHDEQIFSLMFPDIIISKTSYNSCAERCSVLHILFRYYTGPDITNFLLTHLIDIAETCFESSESLLHIVATRGRFDYILQLIVWANRTHFCDRALLNELLYLKDLHGRTFLHVMQYHESFDGCLSYLFNEFGPEAMKQLCVEPDSSGRTILHHFAMRLDCDGLKALLREFSAHFRREIIKELILQADDVGKTALHYHSNKSSSANNPLELLLDFCMKLPSSVFQEILGQTDSKGKLILFKAVKFHKDFEHTLNYLLINFSLSDIKQLLLHTDHRQMTVFHRVARGKNCSNSLLTLLTFVKVKIGDDWLKELLFLKDIRGMTVLHHSCYDWNDLPLIKDILEFAANELTSNDFQTIAFERDLDGKTILHHASCSFISSTIVATLASLKKYFGIHVVDRLILEKDYSGQTILHNAAIQNDYDTIGSIGALLEYARNELDVNVFIRLIQNKNAHGKNAFEILSHQKIKPLLALEAFAASYNWLINVLHSSRNNTGKSLKIYWSELDLVYPYVNTLPNGDLLTELCDKLNGIYNHPAWSEAGKDEWLLELEYTRFPS